MKPIISSLVPSSLALIAVTFSALPALAQTTWNGGGEDTNVDNAENWNGNIAPSLTGTAGVIFTSSNNVATLNVPAAFRMTGTFPFVPAAQFGASFTLDTTGSNSLTLYGTNSGSGFNSWASSNGIPGALPGDDADFDGLSNLTEYALGTNPTASTPAPGTWSGNTITFTKGADAITNADVNYVIETSTDLGVNDQWTAAVTQTAPNSSTTIEYTFTPGSPARKFARLRTVLIP